MNTYFETKLHEISKDAMQLKAYESDNNTVLIAGPGSGKTTVLTLKVMQLLSEKIFSPRGLACLTYNNEAAREFECRLIKLGLEKRKNIFLGTVHSFCLTEILIPFASLYPQYKIPSPIKIISQTQKQDLFNAQKYEGDPKLSDVDKERTRNINGISRVSLGSYDIALKAAISFEEILIENGYLDFTSMIKKSVELIQNESYVRKALEAKYPWIIIDEYQDLGKPLHELILTLLNKTEIKIFAVGDADQSIYDFQGAAPEYLIELSKRSDVSCIHLKNNYRSSQIIVNASELILDCNRGYIAAGKLQNFPTTFEFIECDRGMKEQYEKIIEQICRFHTKGIPYHEIAVLMSGRTELNALAQECSKHNIPTYITQKTLKLTKLIIWLQNCANWTIDKYSVSLDDIYSTWRSFISQKQFISDDDFFLLKKKIFLTLIESKAYTNNLLKWLSYLNNEIGIVSTFSDLERYSEELTNFNQLIKMVQNHDTQLTIKFLTKLGIPENQVILTTRHSSKGLEFDIVILPGMEDGSFPKYFRKSKREQDEDRRICFVSISRARKKCILIRSKELKNKYNNWVKKKPSPFWIALQDFQNKQSME